jgi:hypothetical protein
MHQKAWILIRRALQKRMGINGIVGMRYLSPKSDAGSSPLPASSAKTSEDWEGYVFGHIW